VDGARVQRLTSLELPTHRPDGVVKFIDDRFPGCVLPWNGHNAVFGKVELETGDSENVQPALLIDHVTQRSDPVPITP
jgi:hypothetical protein